jgi:EAL domain-containing protein (putative c-di-GMP-specific phosphodiesterase class I)
VLGVEALVRWRHPRHGLLFPDTFIPLAERSGLIRQLTDEVLEQALAACGRWRREGLRLTVSVNLSARSNFSEELVEGVQALLQRHGVPADALTLEITESSVIKDPARTGEVLDRLHGLGVGLSIDDFGTGYSSLSYLRQLPVQEVKIDKSFVMTMMTQPEDAAIVRSIVDLGANLGLVVVAEGVEDAATWNELERLGCHNLQGFFLAAPMPISDFTEWLAAREGRLVPSQRLH